MTALPLTVLAARPKHTHFSAVLLHPLKQASDFYRFHKQTMSMLRPVQPRISNTSDPTSYRQATSDLRISCVHNPIRQMEVANYYLQECPTPEAQQVPSRPAEATVVVPPGVDGAGSVGAALHRAGIATRIERIKGDGKGLQELAALQRAFLNATFSFQPRLLLVMGHSPLAFRCSFKAELLRVLEDPRCGTHLFTTQQGGVLLLGAEAPRAGAWEKIEVDRAAAARASGTAVTAQLCYNVQGSTEGHFAAIFHRAAYGAVLGWLEVELKAQAPQPFSAVYAHLGDLGYIVRAALPNLVLRGAAQAEGDGAAGAGALWHAGTCPL